MMDWFEMAAAATMAAFVNGIWIGMLLAGVTWGIIRLLSERVSLNATTRFSIWFSVFVICAGLVFWQGARYLQENKSLPVAGFLSVPAPPVAIEPIAPMRPVDAVKPVEPVEPVISVVKVRPLRTGQQELIVTQSQAAKQRQTANQNRIERVAGVNVQAATSNVVVDGDNEADTVDEAEATAVEKDEIDAGGLAAATMQFPDRVELSSLDMFWRSTLFIVWLTIAGMMLLRVAVGWWGIWKLKRSSYPAPERVQKLLQQVMSRLENPRVVGVAVSDEIQTAAALGLFNPIVLLPSSMLGSLSNVELEQVMLHETAHLQRLDDWTMLLQRVVMALFFFHPALILMSKMMDRDREFACDDWVVALTKRPKAYASCLAKLVAQHVRRPAPVVVPGFGSKKDELFDRVKTILDTKRSTSFKLARLAYGGVLAVVMGLLVLAVQVAPVFALPEVTQEAIVAVDAEPLPIAVVAPAPVKPALSSQNVATNTVENTVASVSSVEAARMTGVAEPVQPAEVVGSSGSGASDQTISVISGAEIASSGMATATGFVSVAGFATDAAPNTLPEPVAMPLAQPRSVATQPASGDSAISSKSMVRLLTSARRISSSGDKAQLLVAAAEKKVFDAAVLDAYLETAKTIQSSGDRARALMALTAHQVLDAKSAVKFARTAATIPSESDKSRVLINSLESDKVPLHEDAVRDAYLDAIEKVGSSTEYRRVMNAFLDHTSL